MNTSEKSGVGKRELILIAVILLAALLFLLINRVRHSEPAAIVEIAIDGNTVERLELSRDQEYTVQNPSGGTNRLIIQDGEAWVEEASCPDKICVHQGKISRDGEMIVCLPNRMTARISGTP